MSTLEGFWMYTDTDYGSVYDNENILFKIDENNTIHGFEIDLKKDLLCECYEVPEEELTNISNFIQDIDNYTTEQVRDLYKSGRFEFGDWAIFNVNKP